MADMSNVVAFPTVEHAITWADQARAYRNVLSAEIERLITLLDDFDGDPEAEEHDPPEDADSDSDIAWVEQTDQSQPLLGHSAWCEGGFVSEEVEDDDEDTEHDGREPPW